MKRRLLVTLGLLAGIVSSIALTPSKVKQDAARPETLSVAHIDVNPAEPIGPISDLIYGAGIEWTENGNRIFDSKKGVLREDLIAKLKPLRIPIWRFPGGILSDYYNWQDGVGTRERRPKRANPMDGVEYENNFGTDEFIALCRALGAQGLITANFGTGTLESALAWRDYFKQKGFPIRYWEIGNEIYAAEPRMPASIPGNDQRIYKSPAQYTAGYQQWSQALRTGEPGIFVGGIAGTYNTSPQNKGWLQIVGAAAAQMDFVALHNSFAPLILSSYDYTDSAKRTAAYRAMFAQTMQAAEDIRQVKRQMSARRGGPVQVAITEHFPLFGAGGGREQMAMILDQSRTLASAIYTASLLQMYMREGVMMANYNIATSKWFGALLTDTDEGVVRTPTWHVYDLYRNHFGNQLIRAKLTGPEYSTAAVGQVAARSGISFLDAVASIDSANAIYVAVINRHESRSIDATLDVAGVHGPAETWTLAGAPNAINGKGLSRSTESGPADNIIARKSISPGNGRISFPPFSVTILRWPASAMARQN